MLKSIHKKLPLVEDLELLFGYAQRKAKTDYEMCSRIARVYYYFLKYRIYHRLSKEDKELLINTMSVSFDNNIIHEKYPITHLTINWVRENSIISEYEKTESYIDLSEIKEKLEFRLNDTAQVLSYIINGKEDSLITAKDIENLNDNLKGIIDSELTYLHLDEIQATRLKNKKYRENNQIENAHFTDGLNYQMAKYAHLYRGKVSIRKKVKVIASDLNITTRQIAKVRQLYPLFPDVIKWKTIEDWRKVKLPKEFSREKLFSGIRINSGIRYGMNTYGDAKTLYSGVSIDDEEGEGWTRVGEIEEPEYAFDLYTRVRKQIPKNTSAPICDMMKRIAKKEGRYEEYKGYDIFSELKEYVMEYYFDARDSTGTKHELESLVYYREAMDGLFRRVRAFGWKKFYAKFDLERVMMYYNAGLELENQIYAELEKDNIEW